MGIIFFSYDVYENSHGYIFPKPQSYSSYLVWNPEVKNNAKITVRKEEILLIEADAYYAGKSEYNSAYGVRADIKGSYDRVEPFEGDKVAFVNPKWMTFHNTDMPGFFVAVRFTIDIVPKNGGASTTIVKTCLLNKNIIKK